jgi:outer membrane protein TolC
VTGGLRRLPAALVVAAALATGAVAGVASEQVQDAKQRDRLIESIRSEEQLAKLRIEMAQAEYDDARRRFEVGTGGRDAVDAAERQLRTAQTALARLVLDVEEIRATNAAPRDDLQAPLVAGRDFVRERLALELKAARHALEVAERARAHAQQRVEVGTAKPASVLQAELELEQARSMMLRVQGMIEMRERSLAGGLKAEELAASVRRMELSLQLKRAQRELEIARIRAEEIRRLVETGVATPLDFKRAEVELLEREVELKRLRQELERLGPAKRE